jgi:thiamine transport system permease protein
MRRLLLPVAALLGVFFAWPMALVLREALDASAWQWLAGAYARSRIATAFQQAGLSLLLVLLLAAPLAWLHHRRRIPGSRVLLTLHAATFVLPVFVVAHGLQETLGRGGWLDRWLGVDLLGAVGPLGAVVLANAYYNTGLATRLFHAALERRPRRVEEAAALLGQSPNQVAWRVTLPLLLPALLSTALLVFLFCFGSFGVVLLLGGGAVDTLDTLLYANLRGGFPRVERGAVLALLQITLQACLLATVLGLERRAARFAAEPVRSMKNAGPSSTVTAWMAAAATAAPVLAVLVAGFRLAGGWSLKPWRTLLDPDAPGHLYGFDLGRALGWSLVYAGLAVALAVGLTLLLAYGSRNGRGARSAELLAALPLGTSSVALGFGFLLAFTGRTWLPLFGSPAIVVAAHTLLAFPFTARVVLPALRSLEPRLGEAAATLGASPLRRVLRVDLPLLRGPLLAAGAFAAALSLGDYGASLLLMTDDMMGLSVWIGRHGGPSTFDPLARAQSTALAGLLLVLTVAAFLLFEAGQPRRRRA